MKLSFLGAAHEVTGSCFLLDSDDAKLLIDCGMRQGDDMDAQELLFRPEEIDAVLLTHAHIDHSGNLPLLYKYGFRGTIYATGATTELCTIMLRDSAYIQESEAEWKNRKRRRAGNNKVQPLYTIADAEGVLPLFKTVSYEEVFMPYAGIEVRYFDAGHILGSASIEVTVYEQGQGRTILFSGDVGSDHQPLINNPTRPKGADYIILESTYGNRTHEKQVDHAQMLAKILQSTFDNNGNVVIPSFAVGRTQEILYFLRQVKERGLVKGHGDFPVYVDSPLAIEATNIFGHNTYGYYDEEALALLNAGINPISFSNLQIALTSDESKEINFDKTPKVILSASGMCEAGRIRHHLKHNLWRTECTILFSGFQALGTLGRTLLDGAKQVRLFGEDIQVKAKLISFGSLSAHADKEQLLYWLEGLEKPPTRVFTVHGENMTVMEFADTITDTFGYPTIAPFYGAQYDLLSDTQLKAGTLRAPAKKTQVNTVYQTLIGTGRTLQQVIAKSEGIPNKELRQFNNEILKLIKKWAQDNEA